MKVGLDMISAGSGFGPAAGGMTTYYEGLSRALCRRPEVDELHAYLPPWVEHADIGGHDGLVLHRCEGLPRGRAGRVAYEHLRFAGLVRSTGVDVLLSTSNVRPLLWRGPSVVVLQSMQYFFLPDPIGRVRRAYLQAAVPRSLRSADMVIAVSQAQRLDAIRLFELDPDRIVAVHHGPSPWALTEGAAMRAQPPAPPLALSEPYLLTVSALYGFKNHARLIRAFARLVHDTELPHALVIAGREVDVTIAELEAVAAAEGVGDRVHLTGPYPQADLPALIANAAAIAYVSLYETFGHPVLEAFAFGRPLVTAGVGGAAEVADGAAEIVDPYDVESIASGLYNVLTRQERREELAAAGVERLRDFSWDRCASETVAALAKAIDTHG